MTRQNVEPEGSRQEQSRGQTNRDSELEAIDDQAAPFTDNRRRSAAQRKLQLLAQGSSQTQRLVRLQADLDGRNSQFARHDKSERFSDDLIGKNPDIPLTLKTSSGPVQRRIWASTVGQREWHIVRTGTAGRLERPPLPEAPPRYFNDVTGKTAGRLEDVEAGLVDQAMITGGVEDLMGAEHAWGGVVEKLQELLPSKWETLDELGSIVLRWEGDKSMVEVKPKDKPLPETGHEAQDERNKTVVQNRDFALDLVTPFLLHFMRANGQIDFIERQETYTKGKISICIDVNWYQNRKADLKNLEIHKDTAGDNLFVNLIFGNKKQIPATEWALDFLTPSEERAEVLRKYMPSMHEKIEVARNEMKGHGKNLPGVEQIEGGLLPPMGFVSWVDELVWHSTPMARHRDKTPPVKVRPLFREAARGEDNISNPVKFFDAAQILADQGGSMKTAYQTIEGSEDWDFDVKGLAANLVHWRINNKKFYLEILKQAKTFDVNKYNAWQDASAEALTGEDQYHENKTTVYEETGLQGRKRANSNAATLEKVQNANTGRLQEEGEAEQQIQEKGGSEAGDLEQGLEDKVESVQEEEEKDKPSGRSFIRTWVRIIQN